MLDGHPVIFPTETFFALGSRALDADATARVYRAKHRSTVRPLPLILGDWEQLDMIAKVHDELMPLLKRFWPGPLSVIFPARLRVPDILTGGTGRVAVRLSSHPVARALAQAVGEPITSSSAMMTRSPILQNVWRSSMKKNRKSRLQSTLLFTIQIDFVSVITCEKTLAILHCVKSIMSLASIHF